jgi:hypothetical protein
MRRLLALLFVLLLGICAPLSNGCAGMTLGENAPGRDTYLEDGSIAVDPVTELVYVLRRTEVTHEETDGTRWIETFKHLYQVSPDGGGARHLADVSDLEDLRMLFPRDQVLLMGERGGQDLLRVLDPSTGAVLRELHTDARYHGTRLSPSGRFVAVADNTSTTAPIHIIDTTTYDIVEIPHDGMWLEAMWANDRDVLVAMVDYQRSWGLEAPDPALARMRFLAWDVESLAAAGFPTIDGVFADPIVDVSADGVTLDGAFSFSWVGIDPDDRSAVFPVRAYRPEDPASEGVSLDPEGWHADLLVMDLASGALRRVENAFGPVGFTPDGSTIVSYRYVDVLDDEGMETEVDPQILTIDLMTLATEALELPLEGLPSFFVTREGSWVVVAAVGGNEQLVLYDLDAGTPTRVDGEAVDLNEFVTRPGHPELWLVDGAALHRLDLMSALLERISLSTAVDRINVLRVRDQLVLGTGRGAKITFYDPSTRTELRQVEIPDVITMD